jgi:hypothetical protein
VTASCSSRRSKSLTEAVGTLLAEVDDDRPSPIAAVFLRCAGGNGIELLPRGSAEALLKQVTASPLHDITGDLNCGFAWLVPGAHPRRSYAVVPLSAPVWPHTPHPTAVTVELWWTPDESGRRLVRSFVIWADRPYDAYLIACCLWSTKATGAGAEAAFLYGPDRRVAYRINAAAWTCSNIPAKTIAGAVATVADRNTTDPLPDTPRTSAMKPERIDGTLTYIGTSEEIAACPREHADGREASMDAPGAYAMRMAAEQIESGECTEFRSKTQALYRVVEASSSDKAGVTR